MGIKAENKTAVEWLLWQIEEKNGKDFASYYTEFIQQAKELEKQQIIKAHLHGVIHRFDNPNSASEDYFTQTYGGDNE